MSPRPMRLGEATIHWIGGGLYIDHPSGGLILDTGKASGDWIKANVPKRPLQAIILTSSRGSALHGLLPLLEGLSQQHTPSPIHIIHPMGDERVPLLLQAWTGGWHAGAPVIADAVPPGEVVHLSCGSAHLHPLRVAEQLAGELQALPGFGVRLQIDGQTLAYAPDASSGLATRQLCAAADLVVIGVTLSPPQPSRAFRTLADAKQAGASAGTLWVVDEHGREVSTKERPH